MMAWVWWFLAIVNPLTLWLAFLATMALERAQVDGKLAGPAKVPGEVVALLAYLLDVVFNLTWGSSLGIPREWTLSERLERIKAWRTWRGDLADYVLRYWLDPFDTTGGHRPR